MRYHEVVQEDAFGTDSDLGRDMGRYDPEKDKLHKRELGDTRKPKLTLRIVNRMKKIRSTKRLEMAQKQDILGLMFGDNRGDGGGGGMGGPMM